MGRIKSNDDILYYVGLALLVTAGLVIFAINIVDIELPGCIVHRLTGIYCPGCGGTRAIMYMVKGQFIQSLYHHPAVLPFTVGLLVFLTTHTIEKIKPNGKIRGLKFRLIYIWIFMGLLVLNVVLKNFVY